MTRTNATLPIGVLGGTGQQGGAVVDALLAAGAQVRAVVRDTGSDRAQALARRGVELVVGDQNDAGSLVSAFADVSALFVMGTPFVDGGVAAEVERGFVTAQAAADADVPRVVYSSVGGAERDSGVPHFESKRRIEERLESLLPSQFVRPTYFMDNLAGQLDAAQPGEDLVLRAPMPGDVAVQLVATRDIGVVAAAALLDEHALGGKALEIAGDELTGEQMAAAAGAQLGVPARFEQLPLEALGDDEDLKAMFRWFVDTPAYRADFARTREIDPGVLDLDGWLRRR